MDAIQNCKKEVMVAIKNCDVVMCIDMYTDVCIDMCIEVSIDMCKSMCIDMCVGMPSRAMKV